MIVYKTPTREMQRTIHKGTNVISHGQEINLEKRNWLKLNHYFFDTVGAPNPNVFWFRMVKRVRFMVLTIRNQNGVGLDRFINKEDKC